MTSMLIRSLTVAALAAALASCASPVPGADEDARTPTERFQPTVSSAPEELRLKIHAQGMSPAQADALIKFVDYWQDDEGGMIGVQAPDEGVDAAAVHRMSEHVRSFLIARGVSPAQIEIVGYDADPAAPGEPALVVSYLRYKTEVAKCGEKWGNFTSSMHNRVQGNFGCAVSSNAAIQVANPADLLGPRTVTAPDAARRQDVLDKYRKGEVTSSAKDKQAEGVVSNAVK